MDVAQVQQAQPVQPIGEIGDPDVHFAHLEIQALDERAISDHGKGRRQQCAARGVDQEAARGIEFRSPDSPG